MTKERTPKTIIYRGYKLENLIDAQSLLDKIKEDPVKAIEGAKINDNYQKIRKNRLIRSV